MKRVRLVIRLTIFNKIKITSITLEKGGCRLSAVDTFNLYFLPCECCKEFRLQDSPCFSEQKNSALACWQLRYCLTFHVHQQHHIPSGATGCSHIRAEGIADRGCNECAELFPSVPVFVWSRVVAGVLLLLARLGFPGSASRACKD